MSLMEQFKATELELKHNLPNEIISNISFDTNEAHSPRFKVQLPFAGVRHPQLEAGQRTREPRSALPSSCQKGFSRDPEKTQHFLNRYHPQRSEEQ